MPSVPHRAGPCAPRGARVRGSRLPALAVVLFVLALGACSAGDAESPRSGEATTETTRHAAARPAPEVEEGAYEDAYAAAGPASPERPRGRPRVGIAGGAPGLVTPVPDVDGAPGTVAAPAPRQGPQPQAAPQERAGPREEPVPERRPSRRSDSVPPRDTAPRDPQGAPLQHVQDPEVLQPYLEGVASWYGPGFHGERTANGEVYNQHAMTAAHPVLPMGTRVEVENLENRRRVWVRINDRGPYKKGRILDLSRMAAQELGMIGPGTAPVRISVVSWPEDLEPRMAAYTEHVVQVAAYPERERAAAKARALQERFPGTRFVLEQRPSGFYAVISERYPHRAGAVQLARRLQYAGITSLVRSYRK